MHKDTVRVLARVTALPDKALELKSVLLALVNPTRAEPGCISYELCQSETDPADFVFIEEWRDAAAIVAHMETAHVQRAFSQAAPLLAAPLDISRYHLVA